MKKTRNRKYSPKRGNFKRNTFQNRNRIDISKYVNKRKDLPAQEPYTHLHTFEDFRLHTDLLRQIKQIGYTKPTEIQDKTIPHTLSKRDVIGVAGTGTGKTAAFLIPIIQGLIENPGNHRALIITPTRELASQIFDEFRKITKGLNLYATSLIGGSSVERSVKALRRTNHVIIGTPGRLMDMAQRRLLPLANFETLVLDEFDRMLDMGFQQDMMNIIGKMDAREQTLLFSATLDHSQKSIIQKITSDAIEVKAGNGTQNSTAIEQEVRHIPKDQKKFEILVDVISQEKNPKVILFCETKRLVNDLCKNLKKVDIPADMIHGDKTQKARENALGKFKKGRVKVLVATDVLARGIDVDDVSLVINYEVPSNYNDYIHRIGRTGRAGKTGKAITFID